MKPIINKWVTNIHGMNVINCCGHVDTNDVYLDHLLYAVLKEY